MPILRQVWEAVRPGGVLIVEDADFDGWACHPPNSGFEFFKRTYAEIVHRCDGEVDAALGDLASCSEDSESLIVGPGIFQLWSRRST